MDPCVGIIVEDDAVQSRAARPPAARRPRSGRVAAACVLALVTFVLHVAIGKTLLERGVAEEWNVLFDADPNVYTAAFAHGTSLGSWGGRNFVHPNLTLFVNLPIRIFSRANQALARPGPEAGGAVAERRRLGEFRRTLAWLVDPLVSAARVPLLLFLWARLGVPWGWGVVLTLIDMLSFSSLLFGSIPESYALSGTLMAALLVLAGRTVPRLGRRDLLVWTAIGVLVVGTTITNLIPLGLLFFLWLWVEEHSMLGRFAAMGAMLAAVMGVTLVLYGASAPLYGRPPAFTPLVTPHLKEWSQKRFVRPLQDVPLAIGAGFAPPRPQRMPKSYRGDRHPFILTMRSATSPGAIAVLAAICLGIWGWRRSPPAASHLIWGAGAILAFNWGFHTIYGQELFLYSQHWQLAALVLMAGLTRDFGRWNAAARAGLLVTVAVVAADSLLALRRVLETLAA